MNKLSNEEYLEQEVFRLLEENAFLETEVMEAKKEKDKQETARLKREGERDRHFSRLQKRFSEMEKEGKKNKWMRIRLTFYILSGLVYLIALNGYEVSKISEMLGWLIIAPIIAIGIMCISYLVLAYIINGVINDTFAIGEIQGRLSAIVISKLNKE
jgi:hypothetical protein